MIARARQTPLTDAEVELLTAAIQTLGHVAQLLEAKTATIARLRQLLFGAATEKTRAVLDRAGPSAPAAGADRPGGPEREDPGARRGNESTPGGHGRHGAEAYAGAEHVAVPHSRLKHGDRCPGCAQGKIYAQREPGVLIRWRGQAPLAATVYALQKLRCNLCGEIFTADPPPGGGPEKYDATAASMIALLKYGSGVPFHRLARLQATLAIPLPASTQWESVATAAPAAQPALEELIRVRLFCDEPQVIDFALAWSASGGFTSPRGHFDSEKISESICPREAGLNARPRAAKCPPGRVNHAVAEEPHPIDSPGRPRRRAAQR